ncbi:MAG: circadian clock KaiB family protein [Gemmatimonadaceae bacterium]
MSSTALFKFRLYLAGNTPNSAEAKVNLAALCRRHLPGRYNIEVIDVIRNPNRALTDGIYMTPALIKMAPSPVRMIVGTLSQSDSLLRALGVGEPAGDGSA